MVSHFFGLNAIFGTRKFRRTRGARRRPCSFERLERRAMMAQLQLDTNLDGYVSPLDALLVINDLNANGPHPFVLGGGSPRAGDLFVTMDSSPVRSRHLLGGVLSETVFRLHFRAEGERIDVTDLQLTSRGSNASSIDRLELYTDGSTTPFATATAGGCGSDLVPTVDNACRYGPSAPIWKTGS